MLTHKEIYEALCKRHGKAVQDKLTKARVAIAGLGGLGSNIAIALARIGVGHLHLIDFDRVDLTNLNRQHYFIRHVGQYKTDALKEQILQINPYIQVVTDCLKITADKVPSLFADEDIICEAFDVPEQKAMLVNAVLETLPEKILLSGNGMAGYGNSNAIRTRQILPRFYLCGDEVSGNDTKSLMAPRVAICAAHEANMAAALIIEHIGKEE